MWAEIQKVFHVLDGNSPRFGTGNLFARNRVLEKAIRELKNLIREIRPLARPLLFPPDRLSQFV